MVVFTPIFSIYTRYISGSCAIYQSDLKETDKKCQNGKP